MPKPFTTITLPAEFIFMQPMQLIKNLPDQEKEEEIIAYLNDYLPHSTDEIFYDYFIESEDDTHQKIVLFAADIETIKTYADPVEKEGFTIQKIGVQDYPAINLMPWRLNEKNREKKQKKYLLYCAGGLILIFIIINIVLNIFLENMQIKIDNLTSELKELKNAGQQNTLYPIESIKEQIRDYQRGLNNFFNILSETIPDGAGWLRIKDHNNTITITGYADSFLILSRWIEEYNKKNMLTPIEIASAKKAPPMIQFRLQYSNANLAIPPTFIPS